MKAIVYTEYGQPDALRLEEVKKPALNEEKVLVEVYAASISVGDLHIVCSASPFIVGVAIADVTSAARQSLWLRRMPAIDAADTPPVS